jgi:hypothetical protein
MLSHASVGISNKDVKLFDHHAMRIDVAIHGSLEKTFKESLTDTSQQSGPPGLSSTQSEPAAEGQSSSATTTPSQPSPKQSTLQISFRSLSQHQI